MTPDGGGNVRGRRWAGSGGRGRSLNSLAVQLSAVALSFILIALLVVTSSRAAFVATTANTGNQVSSGVLELTDDDAAAAMFVNVTGLVPGTPVVRCIKVTYTGDMNPVPVKLYATAAPTGALAPYLNLTVDIGPDNADTFSSCTDFVSTATLFPATGTLADFAAAHTDYATGLTAWDPTVTGETRTFRFRLEVQNDPAAAGKSATFGVSWETRSA